MADIFMREETLKQCIIITKHYYFVLNHLFEKQKRMSYDDKVLIFLNFKQIVSSRWDGIGEWRD